MIERHFAESRTLLFALLLCAGCTTVPTQGGSAGIARADRESAAAKSNAPRPCSATPSCEGGVVSTCAKDDSGQPKWQHVHCEAGYCTDATRCAANRCEAGELRTCSKASSKGCAAWRSSACPEGFCFDDAHCGRVRTRQLGTAGDDSPTSASIEPSGRIWIVDARFVTKLESFDAEPKQIRHGLDPALAAFGPSIRIDASPDAGAYLAVSSTTSSWMRLDSNGDPSTQWRGSDASPVALAALGDDGFVVGGPSFVQRRTAKGETTWRASTGKADVRALAVDARGQVLAVGERGNELVASLWSGEGKQIWARSWARGAHARALDVAIDPDKGEIYVSGSVQGRLGEARYGHEDWFVTKLAADGTPAWTKQFGSGGLDDAVSVSVADGGDVVVAGTAGGHVAGGTRYGGVAAMRLSGKDGAPLWQTQWGASSEGGDTVVGGGIGAQGQVIVAGGTQFALGGKELGGKDIFVSAIEPDPQPGRPKVEPLVVFDEDFGNLPNYAGVLAPSIDPAKNPLLFVETIEERRYLVLPTVVDDAWLAGPLKRLGRGSAQRAIDTAKLPRELAAIVGTTVTGYSVWSKLRKVCTAKVGPILAVADDEGYVDDVASRPPLEDIWLGHRRLLVAKLEGAARCGDAAFAMQSDRPAPRILARSKRRTAATKAAVPVALAQPAVRKLDEQIRALARERDDLKRNVREGMIVETWSSPDQSLITFSFSDAFDYEALQVTVVPGTPPVVERVWDAWTILAVLDVEDDGVLELIATDETWRFALFRRGPEGWQMVAGLVDLPKESE